MNKLASARASGQGHGSKVLTDLVDGLEEPAVAVELRLKIDQNNPDLKGGYVYVLVSFNKLGSCVLLRTNRLVLPDHSESTEKQC